MTALFFFYFAVISLVIYAASHYIRTGFDENAGCFLSTFYQGFIG